MTSLFIIEKTYFPKLRKKRINSLNLYYISNFDIKKKLNCIYNRDKRIGQ